MTDRDLTDRQPPDPALPEAGPPEAGLPDPGLPDGELPDVEVEDPVAAPGPPIVDWGRTGRRIRRIALVLGGLVLTVWVVAGFVRDAGFELRLLGELVGLALLVAFVAEVVVVGGAAVVGMLRAGERGERLAGSDVSLLPPQLRRRRRG